jgi:hypothetical protein
MGSNNVFGKVINCRNGQQRQPLDHHHQVQKELFLHNHVLHQRGCPVVQHQQTNNKTSTGTMTSSTHNGKNNLRSIATSSFSTSVDSDASTMIYAPTTTTASDHDEKGKSSHSDAKKKAGEELNNLNTISSKISLIHGDGPTIPLRVMQEGRVWEMGV